MSKKSHLYFKNPVEGKINFRQRSRYSGDSEDEVEETDEESPNINIENLRDSIKSYRAGKEYRSAKKNLRIAQSIDYINIEFYNTFQTRDFTLQYRNDFGIFPVSFNNLNTIGQFVVVDINKFDNFLLEVELITASLGKVDFNNNIRFIKHFEYYNIGLLAQGLEQKSFFALELIDNPELYVSTILPLVKQLISYLDNTNFEVIHNPEFNRIELLNTPLDLIYEVANNFDIIQSISTHNSGIIRPSFVHIPIRSFGFEVQIPREKIPTIGIIDTGISNLTPLAPLIINNNSEFDITNTSPKEDNVNHGTGVASLVIFGDKLYQKECGLIEPDAKVLSIKVLDSTRGSLSDKAVIDLIKQAFYQYGIKIFNLSIGYEDSKKENSLIDKYAYMLDCLSYELDLLIFISAGNNSGDFAPIGDDGNLSIIPYPHQFKMDSAIIQTPAESMNNITIGAASGNFEEFDNINSISFTENSPAYYSCRHHINWKKFNRTGYNKQLVKPDLVNYGGDYDNQLDPEQLGIKLISSQIGEYYKRGVGSSFSTPLTCNIAARLIKFYPDLYNNTQTIKALIINSASSKNYIMETLSPIKICRPTQIIGHGIPSVENCLYSTDNKATIVLEDSIEVGSLQTYPIKFPKYLKELTRQSILNISATLCFKFKPILNHDLAYCPIHISFGFFRNLPQEQQNIEVINGKNKKVDTGINGNKASHTKLGASAWSEDYYYKNKPLSNVQQISFSVSKTKLINEDGIFKIGVSSLYNKLLTNIEKGEISTIYPFSLVITIEDIAKTGNLYNGLVAENNLEVINTLDIDIEDVEIDLFSNI